LTYYAHEQEDYNTQIYMETLSASEPAQIWSAFGYIFPFPTNNMTKSGRNHVIWTGQSGMAIYHYYQVKK
jgi:hypothetical protein